MVLVFVLRTTRYCAFESSNRWSSEALVEKEAALNGLWVVVLGYDVVEDVPFSEEAECQKQSTGCVCQDARKDGVLGVGICVECCGFKHGHSHFPRNT